MTINISENPPAIEGKVLSFDNVMLDPGNHCVLVTPGLVAAAGFDTVLSDAITENGEWTFCVSYPVEIISRNPKGNTFDDITKITINFNQDVALNEQLFANIRILLNRNDTVIFTENNTDDTNVFNSGSMLVVTGFNISQTDQFYIEMDEGFVIPSIVCDDSGYASPSIKKSNNWSFEISEEITTSEKNYQQQNFQKNANSYYYRQPCGDNRP